MANEGPQLKGEIWKDPGVEYLDGKFQVSNYGRVRRKYYNEKAHGNRWVLMYPYDHHAGKRINARRYGKQKTFQVAKLVADAFGLEPLGSQVFYRNGDMDDCSLANIKRIKRRKRLTKAQKVYILDRLKERKCQSGTLIGLSRELDVPIRTLSRLKNTHIARRGMRMTIKKSWENRSNIYTF